MNKTIDRLLFSILLGLPGLVGLVSLPIAASAQEFPTRPVRLVVPYPPGGQPDNIARSLAPSVSASLGQTFIIENRPGGGGLTGLQEVARAAPDGYTLLSADAGQWAIQPALRPGIYDFEKSFAPIALVTTSALYIAVAVRDDVPARNIQEFIALVKSKPGALSYGHAGNGTIHHLFMESFKAAVGLDMLAVPYKGSVQMGQALLAGDIPIGILAIAGAKPHLATGKLRLLVAGTRERSRLTPDVPSMGDIGQTDFNFAGETAYLAPVGTPRAIVERLAGILAKSVQLPDVLQRAEAFGVEMIHRNPVQLAQHIREDVARYARAVKISGAKVD